MHILLFTPQLPFPAHQGTTLRNFHIIKYLAQQHTVDLVTFHPPGQPLAQTTPLHDLCRTIVAIEPPVRGLRQRAIDTLLSARPDMGLRLESAALRRAVTQLVASQHYDLVQVEGIEMGQYGQLAVTLAQQKQQAPPALIFDDHNCEYLLQKRNFLTDLRNPRRWVAAAYSLIQWRKLVAYERALCQKAAGLSAVSDADRAALLRLVPNKAITVIPNGIDLSEFQPAPGTPRADPPTLVFTGKMDYRPNIDAVLWFGQQVFPQIRARCANRLCADVRFQIIGMNPHVRLDQLRGTAGIEIVGAVADVRPYIHAAAVYVIPLRVGGGTRFKALEAMACSKPIVSTLLGAEGLGVRHNQELIVANSAEDFARAVVNLLEADLLEADLPDVDPLENSHSAEIKKKQIETMCQNARRFVEQHFGWEQILPKFAEVYRTVRN